MNEGTVRMARRSRGSVVVGAMAMTIAASAWNVAALAAAPSTSAAQRSFDIPAQSLPQALMMFGRQSGYQVSAEAALTAGRNSTAVSGSLAPGEALSRLLAGTGLTFRFIGTDAVTLERAPQVSPGAIQLAPVRVESAVDDAANHAVVDPGRTEANPGYAAPASSTAFKLPLSLRETPQTVIVVPQAVIRDFSLTDVREVLEFTPGVFIRPERSRDYYDVQSRGYDMQVQFDGVPSPNGMGGRGRSTAPDTAILDRVEVLQGASGLMSGAGAPGGIVNMFRKMPTPAAQTEIQMSTDNWGGWRGGVDIAGPISDSGFGGRLVAVMEKRASYIDDVSGKHAVLYGALEQRLGDATTLAAGFTFDKIYDYSPGSHYGFSTQAHGDVYPDISRKQNWGATWSDLEENSNNVFLRAQHRFSDRWSVQTLLTYEDFETKSLQGSPYRERTEEDWPTLVFGSQQEEWDSDNLAVDIAVQGAFTLFGHEHQTMFGFNGSKRDFGGASGGSAAPLVDPYDPYTWEASEAPGPYSAGWNDYGGWTGKSKNYGGYAGGRFELLDSLHVLAGGRLSWFRQSYDGELDSKDSKVFTPYAAVTWDITGYLTAYAGYTEIFQPQWIGTRDRDNHVLDPVTGENKEAGLKLSLFGEALIAQAGVFRLDQVNVAEPDFAGEYPGVCGGALEPCSQASGKAKAKGWDVSVAGRILPGLQVLAGYSRVKNEGSWFAPERRQSNLALSYAAPNDRWSIGATARHHSGWFWEEEWYFAPGSGLMMSGGEDKFTVVGVNGRYRFTDNLEASVEISNLLDEKYLSQHDWPANGSVWGDPRRAGVTLRARF